MADIKLTINGKVCTAPACSTILQAAERNGIHIPQTVLPGRHQPVRRLPYLRGRTGQPPCQKSPGLLYGGGQGWHGHRDQQRQSAGSPEDHVRAAPVQPRQEVPHLRSEPGDCEFQALAGNWGWRTLPYEGERDLKPIDVSESITRDPNKCILCRRCVSVCKNIQTTSILTAENRGFQTVITPPSACPWATRPAPSAASASLSAPWAPCGDDS